MSYFEKILRVSQQRSIMRWIFIGIKNKCIDKIQVLQSFFTPFLVMLPFKQLIFENKTSCNQLVEKTIIVLKESFFFSWEDRELFLKDFKSEFSDKIIRQVIEDADMICDHIFNFKGSGKKRLGKKINWKTDILSGVQWPSYKSKRVPIIRQMGADIIRTWELNRFQWGPTLGKAYWLTKNDKYIVEFLNDAHDWWRKNPFGFGPNWISAQEVALRAINWIIILCFYGGSSLISKKVWRKVLSILYCHGLFIEKNLTVRWRGDRRITGNHYLSEILGLLFLGILFKNTSKGSLWLKYSISEIESEIIEQTYPDGGHHESSIAGYHRFVLEHFLTAYLIFLQNKIKPSEGFVKRLEKMFDFVVGYTKPDGTVPQIGDTDDARVHIFSNYYNWEKDNHSFLLASGNRIFGNKYMCNFQEEHTEESFWLLHKIGNQRFLLKNISAKEIFSLNTTVSFPNSGFYFMKNQDSCMAISANYVGQKGVGNHKHNDILSFDLFLDGANFIVDPGSYVYTSDPDARNMFRSTSYHNTIMVDDREINPFTEEHLFRMDEKAFPCVRKWECAADYDYFEGVHSGYTRFADPVIHQRRILFLKKRNAWLIHDSIFSDHKKAPVGLHDKATIHKISVFFHFAPLELSVSEENRPRIDLSCFDEHGFDLKNHNKVIPTAAGKRNEKTGYLQLLVYPEDAEITIEKGWISPSYGIKTPAPILRMNGKWPCPAFFAYLITT